MSTEWLNCWLMCSVVPVMQWSHSWGCVTFIQFPLKVFEFVDEALTSVYNLKVCHPRCVCKLDRWKVSQKRNSYDIKDTYPLYHTSCAFD